MIQVYRIESNEGILFDEVCHNCAKQKKEDGLQITYDLYLSEKYPDEVKDDFCVLCQNDFNVDDNVERGELKTDIFSIC